MKTRRQDWAILAIPVLGALFVWFTALAFVPVPWPDDSAFYFVARDFFRWPPRWVMLPQAPFEPSYAIFNFNTMPLYPLLIGIGRFVGIDTPWALKFWSLGFWAAGGVTLLAFLLRAGLPRLAVAAIGCFWALDPELRWSSVIVRPESLISFMGVAVVCGLTFGWPKRLAPRGFWHPTSAALALAAYAHFNAVHLLFPVVAYSVFDFARGRLRDHFREMMRVGVLTALYLAPWALVILSKVSLFIQQMSVQWRRLAVGNDWLSSPSKAVASLFQHMGSPEPLHPVIGAASVMIWAAIAVALVSLVLPLIQHVRRKSADPLLVPAAAWVLGSIWLWHTKPEVWFVHYIHTAIAVFLGVALVKLRSRRPAWIRHAALASVAAVSAIFVFANVHQLRELTRGDTWSWDAYARFIDCIDLRLQEDRAAKTSLAGAAAPYRVWAPTFPDITIALSHRHPDWEFTRTCDFHDRRQLAWEHGRQVEAVVVAETINWEERWINAPASQHPERNSLWMTWDAHYLNELWREPGWKPTRHLCQVGRWSAFLFLK